MAQVLFDDSGVAWGIKATMDGVPQVSYMFIRYTIANHILLFCLFAIWATVTGLFSCDGTF